MSTFSSSKFYGEGAANPWQAPPFPADVAAQGIPPIDAEAEALREVAAGDLFRRQGQYAAARYRFEEAIRLQPQNAQFHCLLAATESCLGHQELAGDILRTAVRLDPRSAQAQDSLGYWYLTQGMVQEGLAASKMAIEIAPNDDGMLANRAIVLEAAGELDEAHAILDGLIRRGTASLASVSLYGWMAQDRTQREAALALIARLLAADGVPSTDRATLHFTAARLFDGLENYDEAFAHADYANRLIRPAYVPAIHDATIDRLIAYYTPERLECLPKASYRSEVPVFIVGMPRSGTSLVEQILASHPLIHGAGELDFMHHLFWGTLGMLEATEAEFPTCLDRLTIDRANGLAQVYLGPLTALNPAAARITDKLPLNFLHLDLVQLLLPNARVIHCRRNPMDTCLSCYMMPFATGNEFNTSLANVGHFHRLQDRLMDHWKKVLRIPILEVQYEEVIADQPGQARRMVEFLGLEWNDRCLRFHETKRAVATGSVQQVRSPIYKTSVERWRNYEKHLGPLKQALGRVD